MTTHRQLTAIVLAAAAAAGCGARPAASSSIALTESLSFTSKSDALVAGSYSRGGVAVGFAVSASAMSLSDGAGAPLLAFQKNGDGSNTVTFLGGAASVKGWVDAAGNDQELDSGDVDAASQQVMARSETQIVPFLSAALAANGAAGSALPVTMQLHSLAQQISSATGVDPTGGKDQAEYPPPMCTPDMNDEPSAPPANGAPASTRRAVAPRQGVAAAAADDCQDLRGDPQCNQCLGMCGPGCTCWKWVCGDCCYHRGCFLHDQHCRACDKKHLRECALCALFDFGRPLFTCN